MLKYKNAIYQFYVKCVNLSTVTLNRGLMSGGIGVIKISSINVVDVIDWKTISYATACVNNCDVIYLKSVSSDDTINLYIIVIYYKLYYRCDNMITFTLSITLEVRLQDEYATVYIC